MHVLPPGDNPIAVNKYIISYAVFLLHFSHDVNGKSMHQFVGIFPIKQLTLVLNLWSIPLYSI